MIHGGNIRKYKKEGQGKKIFDFSANLNPLGFPSWVRPKTESLIQEFSDYPDWEYANLKEVMTSYYDVPAESLVLYNGAAEGMMVIVRALNIKKAIMFAPSFYQYKRSMEAIEGEVEFLALDSQGKMNLDELDSPLQKDPRQIVFLNTPHNPTGELLNPNKIKEKIEAFPQTIFLLDEAFIDFCEGENLSLLGKNYDNLIVLRSLTKILAIPGVRFGFSYASQGINELIKKQLPFWNVNQLAQGLIQEFYENKPRQFIKTSQQEVQKLADHFKKGLTEFPLKWFESACNFLTLELEKGNALDLHEFSLKEFGVALRTSDHFMGLDSYKHLRVAIRPIEEQEQLFLAFSNYFNKINFKVPKRKIEKKVPALMVQGTTSNAGKSILAAALCRILANRGYKVKPFKSQNMALNSFVTPEGGEIGRAQAVQAMAAKLQPHVLMNPLLLKPNSDVGSQVILRGKPIKHMNFKEYFKVRPQYFEEVKKCYNELSQDAEIMVIEGAGSPSEINLKAFDIVNMNMARFAKADVLLAADIDRGGMFASFFGTINTLQEWERKLVKGFIINRFRGDQSLLNPGIDFLQKYTGIPTVGCIPFIKNHRIPEEDCLEFKSGNLDDQKELGDRLDIAIIDTPRISNFTDYDPLTGEPDVKVRIVRTLEELGKPHAIFLLGSKSVMRDLTYLRESGLEKAILSLHKTEKVPLIGICGGMQMLGKRIFDPLHIEGPINEMKGIGLLDIETTLQKSKLLGQVEGEFLPWGTTLQGYEIHHGESKISGNNCKGVVKVANRIVGFSNIEGSVWGSYLHGKLDNDLFRRQLIDFLYSHHAKANPSEGKIRYRFDLNQNIDYLAKVVEENLDMDSLLRGVGLL